MKLELTFRFFQDDASGAFGIAHDNAIDNGFYAFWDGTGVFHDVLEHWQEDVHPYFRGDNAFNVGGEMFAMGSMIYLVENLCFQRWADLKSYAGYPALNARNQTQSEIQEAIQYGGGRFGSTLECGVPKQRMSDNSTIEEIINEMWGNVQSFPVGESCRGKDEKRYARAYRKSVTKRKIANLHRFGYNTAKRLYPRTPHNIQEIQEFYEYWKKFTQAIDLKEHTSLEGTYLHFTIHTGCRMRWSAHTNGVKITKRVSPEMFLDKLYSI